MTKLQPYSLPVAVTYSNRHVVYSKPAEFTIMSCDNSFDLIDYRFNDTKSVNTMHEEI